MVGPVTLWLQQCFVGGQTGLDTWSDSDSEFFSIVRWDQLFNARLALQWLRQRGADRDENWHKTDFALRLERLCRWALVYAVHVAEQAALAGNEDQRYNVEQALARGEVTRVELVRLATHLFNAQRVDDPASPLPYRAAS